MQCDMSAIISKFYVEMWISYPQEMCISALSDRLFCGNVDKLSTMIVDKLGKCDMIRIISSLEMWIKWKCG
jgi:hypothetical protein